VKKRLIAKAEEARVAAAHATEQQRSGKDGIKSIFTSEAATTMLVKDCMAFMAAGDASLKVAPVKENVFQWQVKMSGFEEDSKIHQGLQKLKQQFGYDSVSLEVKFMPDLYPFFPPSIRLVRPRMRSFMIGRLVCLPEVQLSTWNPTRTLAEIFDAIRRVITSFGEVDDSEPAVNDPDSELQPYTALEFELLRLTMLTDIAPRVVKTMPDAEGAKLFAPKSKPKDAFATKSPEKDNSAAAQPIIAHSQLYGAPQAGGFKKGTGYGGGHRDTSAWDVEAWRAAQMKRESEIVEIAHSLSVEMENAIVPASLGGVLENSCLLPFLQEYLANDSIADMEAHSVINHSVLDICKNMAKHENLVRLFELLPGEKKSLASYIGDLRQTASVVAKFEKFNPKGKGSEPVEESAANPTGYDTGLFSPSAHVTKKVSR
jgi:baculoviral IAP repeat-containing protein 6